MVAIGQRYVSQSVSLPNGVHSIRVVSASGDTFRLRASIGDSPSFRLLMKCKTIWYPGVNGATADSIR